MGTTHRAPFAGLAALRTILTRQPGLQQVLLGTGRILVQPCSVVFKTTGSLSIARYLPTSTLLNDGRVLLAGGQNAFGVALPDAELYDPASGTWTTTGILITPRSVHTATRLPDGRILIAGGYFGNALATAELYDPATGLWGIGIRLPRRAPGRSRRRRP